CVRDGYGSGLDHW
nr:immunoglobulin heavy chain junction region [Macaca mulatta]MOY19225.1 immunoglobulin heavy chain junction region [Macaca mulatta]MOY19362.1 immunoglobulin heavy chain junction region [Macaca mulatta]MOY19540.1 immunoglobulin heavy chain junction region [Macaca mulatta]MOY19769.1 immunoglobulin heavy chain junction region [Macaca mulatta]